MDTKSASPVTYIPSDLIAATGCALFGALTLPFGGLYNAIPLCYTRHLPLTHFALSNGGLT